jgi:hypothetical protein
VASARVATPLALLLAGAAAFGAAAFGGATPAFDDHPGQVYRLWLALRQGLVPWTWNPGWWAGYPELQFYPPGFFYLGAIVHRAALGALSPAATYQVLLWLAWLAPGLAAFAVLTRLLGDGWLALPGAFVALTLSAGLSSGVEGGVHVGMLPARLGWALLPAVTLALLGWRDGRRTGLAVPAAAVPLLAALALTHPAHLPAAAALALAVAWPGGQGRRQRLAGAAAALAIAALITAFWSLPLLVHLEHTRALAWGRFTPAETLTAHPLLPALLVLAAAAARTADSAAARAVAAWPWLAAALVAVDALVLEPAGLRWLPADRVADGAWMAVVLAAGSAGGALIRRLAARLSAPVAAVSLASVLATGFAGAGGALLVWPAPAAWPSWEATARGLRLDDLWAALQRAPEGRVLFVRSGVPLVYGTQWWRAHTHAMALAPIHAGREIVNGTFTHPSPVAALLYRGSVDPGPITALVETLDGRTLFGRPLGRLDAATLDLLADRLGVAVIVALDEDVPALEPVAISAGWVPGPTPGPFRLYLRPAGVPLPRRLDRDRWEASVDGEPGAWVHTRVAYYPLWSARRGGAPLETRRGPAGDLEVRLDAGRGPIELVYRAGTAERAGVLVSALGLAAWLLTARRPRRPTPGRAGWCG